MEFNILKLHQYKALFIVVTAVLALLVASPALQRVLVYPQTEFFTELGVLGPAHMAENYPYNITRNQNYTVFLDVINHLGSCAYYQVQVKFRNATQSAPDSVNRVSSSLRSLYNLTFFVANQESLETPINLALDYSFQKVSRTVFNNVTVFNGAGKNNTIELRPSNITLLQVNFESLRLNGEALNLRGLTSDWNATTRMFYGNLVLELWIYNGATSGFQYHERFVDLKLNMTSAGLDDIFVG